MNNNFNRYARNQLSMEAEQNEIYEMVLGLRVVDLKEEAERYE